MIYWGGEGGMRCCSRWSDKELGIRMGDWTWSNRGRAEDLQLAYLFPWREFPVGSEEVPGRVLTWNKAVSCGRKVRWARFVSSTGDGGCCGRVASAGGMLLNQG